MNEDLPAEARARMVDVTDKDVTKRTALAFCVVKMEAGTRAAVLDRALPKGDALEVARIAGIMAAKRTSELIPLCHPLAIGAIDVTFESSDHGIEVRTTVTTTDRTGVEMEALTATAIAALTIYDMVKAIDRAVEVTDLRLMEKSGGRSGDWSRA